MGDVNSYQLLLSNAYLNENTFDYKLIQRIGNKLIQFGDSIQRIDESVDLVSNCLHKYGFMHYANDSILKYNGKIPNCAVHITYHLSNFIFNAKSLLDSLAILTKHFLFLNVNGGDIDLNKDKLLNLLIVKEPAFSKIFENKKSWIQSVVKWRNDLIHKKGMTVLPMVSQGHEPSYDELGNMKVQMMKQSGGITEITDMFKNPKNHRPYFQEIEPFCKEWLDNSRSILKSSLLILYPK